MVAHFEAITFDSFMMGAVLGSRYRNIEMIVNRLRHKCSPSELPELHWQTTAWTATIFVKSVSIDAMCMGVRAVQELINYAYSRVAARRERSPNAFKNTRTLSARSRSPSRAHRKSATEPTGKFYHLSVTPPHDPRNLKLMDPTPVSHTKAVAAAAHSKKPTVLKKSRPPAHKRRSSSIFRF